MYIDRKLFRRMLKSTLAELLDEKSNNRLEGIAKDPVLRDRLFSLANQLDKIGK